MRTNKVFIALGGICTLLLLAADQITKYFAHTYLAGTYGFSLIQGIFELYYLENRGAAFGILNDCQFFFIIIALIIAALAIYVYVRLPLDRVFYPLRFVCILITAGAAGNMIDRIVRGYVVDFLYFSLIDFPIFNIADCYVCIGAVLAVVVLF
ncbi:MAG: signal peptidase II, partial [Lachnospiraceae bacterium]|nr:signal peptidase II [Lachnospiraceae bacterium]